jgi:hypothetical protein
VVRRRALGVAVLAGVGGLVLTLMAARRGDDEAARLHAEIAALEREREQLTSELERLRGRAQPRVYLGGDEHTDLVLDARRFMHARYDEGGQP